ncbi:MAG: hypothetical protein KF890_14985 [Nitrospira sp.]|nr:hypothetical protein [Nitrospira sp.]
MGCDIHFRVEKRVDGEWKPAEQMVANQYWEPGSDEPETNPKELYDGRNYSLFAILADVRNGRGFAGCDIGNGFNPIAPPRGLPPDVSKSVSEDSERWGGDGHSHSWFTLAELLAYDWTQTTKQRGYVNGLEAEEWFRMRAWDVRPKSYCGDVGGGGVRKISIGEMETIITGIKTELKDQPWETIQDTIRTRLRSVYAQAEWEIDYASCCKDFWYGTIPKLLQIAPGKPENVRIVFWFDN